METENKFVVRGKVTRTYAQKIEKQKGEEYTEYYVAIEVDTYNRDRKAYVNVPYREPLKVKVGDMVEASGYIVGRSSDKTEPFLNTICGKTLTVLKRVFLKCSSNKTSATASLEAISRKRVI